MEALKPAIRNVEFTLIRRLDDLANICADSTCLVVVELGDKVAELIVSRGEVVAARMLDGNVTYGEDVVKQVAARVPVEARVAKLRSKFYDWNDNEFTVYIRGIDLQHKQLVRVLNNLYQALVEGRAAHAYEALHFMREYAGFHFSTEERLFDRYGYPRADEHRMQHAWFIKKVDDLNNVLKEAGPHASIEMMAFLAEWVKNHILGADRDYGKWLVETGKLPASTVRKLT